METSKIPKPRRVNIFKTLRSWFRLRARVTELETQLKAARAESARRLHCFGQLASEVMTPRTGQFQGDAVSYEAVVREVKRMVLWLECENRHLRRQLDFDLVLHAWVKNHGKGCVVVGQVDGQTKYAGIQGDWHHSPDDVTPFRDHQTAESFAMEVINVFDRDDGVVKSWHVCSGAARVLYTRIPVWVLEVCRRDGLSDEAIRDKFYPYISASQMPKVWAYVQTHQQEIEDDIARRNEMEPFPWPVTTKQA